MGRRATGAATVEAVILLPVLVVLLLGVRQVQRFRSAELEAQGRARQCAWGYAMSGCRAVPAGCEGLVGGGAAPAARRSGDPVDAALGRLPAGSGIDRLPLLRDAVAGFLPQRGAANVEVPVPSAPGLPPRVARGRLSVACRPVPRSEDVVTAVFDAATEQFFGGGS